MSDALQLFATAPKGVEPILEAELSALGASHIRQRQGGVAFDGKLETAFRACLWSRTASRVLLVLAEVPGGSADALYEGVAALPWEEHLSTDRTMAVDFVGRSPAFGHSRFGAQRVKDAVVDRLRARTGSRPSVDLERPDLRINVHLARDRAQVAIDLSGESLHRRGYRGAGLAAPLKENLAAALLLKAGWPDVARAGGSLLDPLCGSGTFPIEAALIAADRAPGLERPRWGFDGWLGHLPELWRRLIEEARERASAGLAALPPIAGTDRDTRAVRAARENCARAGIGALIRLERSDLAEAGPPGPPGLVIANPPYGERLGDADALAATYETLGDLLKARFEGWRAAVFTASPELGLRMGLKARRRNRFFNGAIPCVLLQFEVTPEAFVDRAAADRRARERTIEEALSGAGLDLYNRLRKNLRTLGRWAEREGIECYRLYDADIPELAVAVDLYGEWVHVQEYAPPPSVDPARAAQRLQQIMAVLPLALERPPGQIALKVRRRQRGPDQYGRQAQRQEWQEVGEGPARLLVNLTDYLDTGLFLDHRPTRAMIREMARGRRFLNLFCYTAAASVHAGLGGAASTLSVDLSRTYLDWARRNLELNGLSGATHRLVRADCRQWVAACAERFDLIFLDPPTFSASKRMTGTWDVQRDHPGMIRATAALLAPGGTLIFSTNHRRFRLDREALAGLEIEDISRRTLPRDFARNPRTHQCFLVRRQAGP
ncbi:MAG: bifunctional 23S rRNA (guanine(2069)-N(7))-methyltransferase RlmK/23S rRNA (guanine(2445)-N(2))-methyltransferase RlmL [Chromatiales bacterium]|jgi:23S rRNA (guanine2445-N2)-methyltransferase / 23S rRNA (guanine2069-N7)-methyltransferase